MMPLTFADVGQSQIIKRIGGSPEVKKHLEDGAKSRLLRSTRVRI